MITHDEVRALAERSSATDRSLLESFFSGDDESLIELYDRHHHRMRIYCARIVGSHERAEDLVQDMWERVARLRAEHPHIDKPIALFYRIVRNLSINELRARGRTTPIDDLAEEHHPRYAIPELSEEAEIVRICMKRLRPEGRQILLLNLYSGYRLDEIAAMIGKSPEAVRQQASRTLRELRRMIAAMIRDETSPVQDRGQSLGEG